MKKELIQLYKDGFPNDGDDFAEWFAEKYKRKALTAKIGHKIVCAGYVINKKAAIFGKSYNISYLSALSTQTAQRGKGYIGEVIRRALNNLFAKKSPFAVLNPFNYDYYKKYGFTDIYGGNQSVISGGTSYQARKADEEDIPLMTALYQKTAADFDIFQKCGEKYFSVLYADNKISGGNIYIFYDSGNPFAYAAVEGAEITHIGGDLKKLEAAENLKGLSFTDYYKDGIFNQLRIADAKRFLSLPIYKSDGDYFYYLKDSIIEGNCGAYEVKVKSGKAAVKKVKPTAGRPSDISELGREFCEGKGFFKKVKILFEDRY